MQQLKKFGIVIHGGAGDIPLNISQIYENEVKQALKNALEYGYQKLEDKQSAVDAVEIAVRIMEDFPLFNAGKGSVKTDNGEFEMDAGIMDGSKRISGAVGCIKNVKNPISVARKVMENSKFNLFCGIGAEQFAKEQNCEFAESSYFESKEFRNKLSQQINQEQKEINDNKEQQQKYGTVGAVALDQFGNLAAATSTGGLYKKKNGRIGDSPIIGHGNYANKLCAISATGKGENIMNAVMAYDVAAYMEYKQTTLEQAVNYVLFEKFKEFGPDSQGGLIAIDSEGNFCFPFNTLGMNRGVKMSDGKYDVLIH